jgi:cytochrome P450
MKHLVPRGINPYAPGFLADPWAAYRELNTAGEVLWHPGLQTWLVPGHAAAREVLREPAYAAVELGDRLARLGERGRQALPSLSGMLKMVPFNTNAPAHGPMRRIFAAVLAAHPVSGHAPAIREIAEQLLAAPRANGRFDAVQEFADLVPPLFMAHLLGIPKADVPALLSLTAGMARMFNRLLHLREYGEIERRVAEGAELLRRIAAQRRRSPEDDGISRLTALRQDGRTLDDMQIARYCYVMFLVGSETTITLIGSALRFLVDHPGKCEELRAQRDLMPGAVEEFLRCESPVQMSTRVAAEPRSLAGMDIKAGDSVLVLLGAANRDPRRYTQPDDFDARRAGPPHLAFGDGMHTCVGATLARIEARVALESFLDLPYCRRSRSGDEWGPYDWLRRLRELPVEFA